MKQFAPLLLLLSLAFSCTPPAQENETTSKIDEKNRPFEHFYFQRSFPDSVVDFKVMERSLKDAQQWSMSRSGRADEGEWVQEGPYNIGGRINCIAVHPYDADIIFTGTAGGGIFKTIDGGDTWEPITDELSHLPIGDIAIDPTNPGIIYAGTGDPNIGGTVWVGSGVYKSIDGGQTWTNIGLQETRIVSKIVINPDNPEQIFVGTMGLPFEANNDRGLYRSNDGGQTWEQVLFVSNDSGIIDLIMNPDNPSVLYAANFNRIRTAFESVAEGDEAGIYKTSDGGNTWTELTNGLPIGPMSRIGLKMWEGNSNVVFAQYVNEDYQLEGIYKSTNAGASFSEINTSGIPENALGGFGWYFGKIAVNPYDVNEISLLGVDMYTTFNSGSTWELSVPIWWEYEVHADKHAMQYLGPNEVLLATDGGLYRTTDGLDTWTDQDEIPNTQFYRITTNPHQPGMVLGGAQDNGTSVGYLGDAETPWLRLFGGDGFTPMVDPIDPTLVYTTTQYGNFYFMYTDFETYTDVDYLDAGLDPEDRVNWDAPFVMSPLDNTVLYTGTEKVYQMTDAPYGVWIPISPVLVSPSQEVYARRNVSSLAPSPLSSEVLYAGTSDGLVWATTDEGQNWTNVSADLPEFYVTDIKAAPYDSATVFVTFSGYRDNDNTAHLFRSQDYGQSWESVTGDLPNMPINHIEIYDELSWFIATDNGVYYTLNSGQNWDRLGTNMPYIVVLDLHIDHQLNTLLAGTFARSVMSYDLGGIPVSAPTTQIQSGESAVSIYPNPTSNMLYFSTKNTKVERWTVFSATGAQLHEGHFEPEQSRVSLHVADWEPGVYVLRGTRNDGTPAFAEQFIVQ